MPITLLVASPDEAFRESIRDNLANQPQAKVAAEYPEVSQNLYIRVLQDLDRHPEAGLVVDIASDPENALKAVEKVKLAVPGLYIVASNFHADGETVIHSLRAGANDFLLQPLKRVEFRDAMARLERAPKRVTVSESRLGKIYSFLGAKGGVGTTTLAVNVATILAQNQRNTVLADLDFTANECAMQMGVAPAHSFQEVADNLARLDQALFEGLLVRDASGFVLVGPPEQIELRPNFTGGMFRDFANFLVEKYDTVIVDAGRWVNDDLTLAALESSSTIFLVMTQHFSSIRNAQRYLGSLMRMGFTQDQVKVVVNQFVKKPDPALATAEQIQQTLNIKPFARIPLSPAALAAVNRGRPVAASKTGELDRSLRAFTEKATGVKTAVAKTA